MGDLAVLNAAIQKVGTKRKSMGAEQAGHEVAASSETNLKEFE